MIPLAIKVRRWMERLWLTQQDLSTADGRAKERARRAALTSLTSALARGIGMATPLVTIPLTLGYLGQEMYGLWTTVTSFVGMFVFADLGLGNGLLTSLSRAHGRGDLATARRLVSTSVLILSAAAIVFTLISGIMWPWLPWPKLVNAKGASGDMASSVVAAYGVCFLLNLPLATVQRVQMALQEGFQSNLWQCTANLLGLFVVVVAVWMKLSPVGFVLATSFAPLAVAAFNWIAFFGWSRPDLRPALRWFSAAEAKSLLHTGLGFLVLSLLTTLGLYADNVIVAHTSGLGSVVAFSIPARVALILGAVVNMICAPMWAANGEAMARGDVDWVRQNTRKLTLISIGITGIATVAMVLLGPWLLRYWLGPDFQVSYWLLAGLGLQAVLLGAASPWFMVLNAAGAVWPQILVFSAFTPIAVGLKAGFGRVWGIEAVPICGAVAYGTIVLPWVVWRGKRILELHKQGVAY